MQTTDPTNLWQSESALATAEARKAKAAKNKDVGSPIQLSGKPLAIYAVARSSDERPATLDQTNSFELATVEEACCPSAMPALQD